MFTKIDLLHRPGSVGRDRIRAALALVLLLTLLTLTVLGLGDPRPALLGDPRPALGETAGPSMGLIWSAFLGGSELDEGHDIAVDAAGNVYLVVFTRSPDFPVTAGAFDTTFNGVEDTVVMKFDPSGSTLFSTFVGGRDVDRGLALAVDDAGSAYVVGRTFSPDFPVTPGAFDTTHNGREDSFILKLDPSGSKLLYSTYVGGTGFERAMRLAIDSEGNAYVGGGTNSRDFPTTVGAFDRTFHGPGPTLPPQPGVLQLGDGFALKLDPTGSSLIYSTFVGGMGADSLVGVAVDADGNAYITGFTGSADFPVTAGAFDTTYNGSLDSFAAKLDRTGSQVIWSSYVGGSSVDRATGKGIVIDSAGNSYLLGGTYSQDFPVTAGAFDTTFNGPPLLDPKSEDPEGPMGDSYLVKLDPTGSRAVFATYLGGRGFEKDNGIVVDAFGEVYLSGRTSSTDFPMTPGAFDPTHNGGEDSFLLIMEPKGSSLIASTFLGGRADDKPTRIAVDREGTLYVTGYTRSTDFPVTTGASDTTFNGVQDAYLTKIALVTRSRIDIKPGSERNPVKLRSSGAIPIAIFSSADFDATQVDPATVTLAGASVRHGNGGALLAHREDVDGDGSLDLLVQIDTDQLEVGPGTTVVRLRGRTFDGTPLRGEDVIAVVSGE